MKFIIVHRWGGTPSGTDAEGVNSSDFYPWLKNELEKRKHEVIIPEMPDTHYPKIEEWVPVLKGLDIDENTILIGHSIGCLTILQYLEKYKTKVNSCLFVAGWFNLSEETMQEEGTPEIVNPWTKAPLDFDKIKKNCPKFAALFSDNDPYVSADQAKLFEQRLNAKTIIEHNKGHYNETEEPTVLNALLSLVD